MFPKFILTSGLDRNWVSGTDLCNSFVFKTLLKEGRSQNPEEERIHSLVTTMVFASCIRRSASPLASVCGRVARSQAISAVVVVNRSSLAHNPSSLLRPFGSRSLLYSTDTNDRLKSDQTLIQVIDAEIKDAFDADVVNKTPFHFSLLEKIRIEEYCCLG